MKYLFTSIIIGIVSHLSFAQGCNQAIMFTQGAVYELESYTGKDKKQSKIEYTVKQVSNEAGKSVASLHSKIYDAKDKLAHETDLKAICDGDKFYIDMSEAFKAMQQEGPGSAYEMKMDNSMVEIPHQLTVGQSLPDMVSKISMYDKQSKTEMMQMVITGRKRKVVAKETLTTPAGTFDCYKINYETLIENTMLMMNMKMPSFVLQENLYFNQEAGMVKVENLNKDGDKVKSYTILTKFKK
jgi:hypothetical protein